MIIKNYIANLLCSNFIGGILEFIFRNKIPSRRYGYFIYDCSSEAILRKAKAAIFWGIYESAEVRYVRKYLKKGLDVIELGASIGVVSTQILARINKDKKLIALEANPYLINTLNQNLILNKRFDNFAVINSAIDYNNQNEVKFFIEKNNVNSSTKKADGNYIIVNTTNLSQIVDSNNISSFALVADIEGTEIEILICEPGILANCEQLFIELHDTTYKGKSYTVSDMVNILVAEIGFKLIANYGTVYFFNR